MIEVFLYRCDVCDTVCAIDTDRGEKFYIDECPACKHWSDYEKIVITTKMNDYGSVGQMFVVEGKKDEENE